MMRKPSLSLAAGTALGLFVVGCGLSPANHTINGRRPNLGAQAVSGEVLVKFKSGMGASALAKTLADYGLQRVSSRGMLAKIGWHKLRFDGSRGSGADVINRLKADPAILRAEPNYVVQLPPMKSKKRLRNDEPSITYDDPMAPDQYTLGKLETAKAHAITMGSESTTLAIVDTGVDYDHPDFMHPDARHSRVVKGKDFANDDDDPDDKYGHGTHVAGIAAATANNKEGIVGIAPKVAILAVKVLGDSGSGTYEGVASGIVYAADQGAKVINMSLGGSSTAQVLDDAVTYAMGKDVLIIAAMGNSYGNFKSYPAAIPGVMAVISTDNEDAKSDFSNYGDWSSVSGPGSDVLSALPTFDNVIGQKNYGTLSGTSMATPAVAGLAALVRDLHPDWLAPAVRAKIEQSADDLGDPGYDIMFGHGRVNALKALKDARR